ncbi:protoporphyrinogen oxidase [Agilicoccus flavus]|uniref:protoporphyrinogen oxidase n=1 Tax=Agilicoccus flavus TaxID=2775968 RepID=UPI001CF64EC4|nr:protoporphyrinogen oxidase [Agilicoccus flavus]
MSTPPRPCRVAVVGAGLTGLLAARRLHLAGVDVLVLEAGDRVGGQIRTVPFAGRRVDVGAEALHLLAPAARALLDELGVMGDVVGSVPGASLVWTSGRLRRLPAGVGPAGPTRLWPVLRSGFLSPAGLLRAGLEPLRARTSRRLRAGHDTSVGAFTTSRFGPQVTARLVDPLLGGLHSGDVGRLSLRACVPTLVSAASSGRSLVLRRAPATTRPVAPATERPSGGPGTPAAAGTPPGPPVTFATFRTGLSTLLDRIAADLPSPVRTGTRVDALDRDGDGYVLTTSPADGRADRRPGPRARERVDGVVLAVPAHVAARLLDGPAPGAAAPLRRTRYASTAAVVVAFRRRDVAGAAALAGTGILVPSEAGGLLKAATHLSTKWPHLAAPSPVGTAAGDGTTGDGADGGARGDAAHDDDLYLVRLSAGRAGADVVAGLSDPDLVSGLLADFARLTGIDAAPVDTLVQRWDPGLPQLTVGHLDRMAAARAALAADLPGVALAGASYDGIGLASCITSADRAAADLLRPPA